MHLKLILKKRFKKRAEETGNLIGMKITDKITRTSKPTPKTYQ